MKKVLLILSYIILIGAGVFGTLYFKNLNDKQVAANTELNQNMAAVQSELDMIGTLVTVYEVMADVNSLHKFTMDDLKEVSIPQSAVGSSYVMNPNDIIGMSSKIDIKAGTILTMDMIMSEESSGKFLVDITLPYLPIHLENGEYIDIYAMLANGESIPVLSHKEVISIMDYTVQLNLSQEELYCWNAFLYDYALFQPYGFTFYPTRYIAPGIDTTVAFYPVQADTENMVRFDINVEDPSRCINEKLRGHIDLVNSIATTDTNAAMTGQISNLFTDQAELLKELRQRRIEEEEAAAEESQQDLQVITDTTGTGDIITDVPVDNFDTVVDDAAEDLDTGLQDLSVIE